MRDMILRRARCAVRPIALLVPLALATVACGEKKNVDEDSGAVTGMTTESTAGSTTRAPATAAGVDAKTVAALEKMGAYVRSLKAFQIKAQTTHDEVLEDGQNIQYAATTDLLARRPDRMRIEVTGDRQHRLYLYNGKDFTVFAGLLNYYATVPAPATIAKLIDHLDAKYRLEMPLRDLFSWGTDESQVADLSAARDMGPSAVEGTTCEHYALRQSGLDWQVWIQNGDYPLPRKVVLTTLTDEARPQYSAVLTWNLAPSFNDAAFTFDPPEGAHRIVFDTTGTLPDSTAKKQEK